MSATPVQSIAFLLFPGVTQLDLTGPAQVLSRLPGAQIDLVWHSLDPVPTDAGFSILPTKRLADLPAPDVICIPGGMGITDVINDEAALNWVRDAGTRAAWVTSVCTGALILGAAGLLQGYQATTHWAWHAHLALFGAEPVHARTVFDRNRVTGGGVTAGIDFALALVAQLTDAATAQTIQLALEYSPAPPFAAGSRDVAGADIVAAYQARANRLAPNRVAELKAAAARLGFST